jgi:hypothetical protein
LKNLSKSILDQTGRDERTMGIPARFAVAQRSTAEYLGLFAAAQRLDDADR